jgi:Acyl-coenzyme A:6-aminopenicillanic acid acyl-transferase
MRITRLLPAAALSLLALSLGVSSCSSEDDAASGPNVPSGSKLERDGYTIVRLHGTPYEMGYQHGTLLNAQLHEAGQFLLSDPLFKILRDAAKIANLEDIALANSYPSMIEECRGMVDAVRDPDFTLFECMLVNFGDVAVEFLEQGMPEVEDLAPGCSQIVVSGDATPDGQLYHARVLDWFGVDFVVDNPVIFVREPNDGIPHVFVGFPGNLSSYQGMNAEGIVVASNEIDPRDPSVHDSTGRSHVQMVVEILSKATTLDDAREIVTTANHMTLETLVVSDGKTRRAEVYELAPQHVAIRPLEDGVVFATNHFVGEKTSPLDKDPAGDSSMIRWERLAELVPPTSPTTRYGSFDPEGLIELMRDRVNPRTGEESPAGEIDDGASLATNGALYQVVFAPESLSFWVAAGKLPVPKQPFVGFNLGEMLDRDGYLTPSTLP